MPHEEEKNMSDFELAHIKGEGAPIKNITCNKCDFKFQTQRENKDIRCPNCKSKESLSIR